MNKKHFSIILLAVFLTIITFVSRLAFLSDVPNHLRQDEVAIGYNAYSILKTGRDEWGKLLPVHFKSVGDYKPPILIYLTTISLAIFGKSEFAVRFPVAMFSCLSVFAFFSLTKRFIFTEKNKKFAWISTFLFSLSHWHIYFSRSDFEAVIALFFFLLNLYFLLKFFTDSKHSSLIISIIFAFLSSVTYHSNKLFVPLFNVIVLLIYKKETLSFLKNNIQQKMTRKNLFTLLLLTSFTFLFIKYFLFGNAMARGRSTFIVNDFEFRRAIMDHLSKFSQNQISKYFLLINFWLHRYLQYLSPSFYFTNSGLFTLPNRLEPGTLSLIEGTFVAIGTLALLKLKQIKFLRSKSQISCLLFAWFFTAILPASLANNALHPLRSLNALPVLLILATIGFAVIYKKIKSFRLKYGVIFISILLLTLSKLRFLDSYLIHYPVQLSENRHYGWSQVAKYAIKNKNKYKKIIVDPRFGQQGQNIVASPHYYFLFYSNFNAEKYNSDPRRHKENTDFSNFTFRQIHWQAEQHRDKLFIASPWSFDLDNVPIENIKLKIYNPNESLAFIAVDGNF